MEKAENALEWREKRVRMEYAGEDGVSFDVNDRRGKRIFRKVSYDE